MSNLHESLANHHAVSIVGVTARITVACCAWIRIIRVHSRLSEVGKGTVFTMLSSCGNQYVWTCVLGWLTKGLLTCIALTVVTHSTSSLIIAVGEGIQ